MRLRPLSLLFGALAVALVVAGLPGLVAKDKPAAGGISSAMGNTFGPNKTNLPNPDKGHVVRDQTMSNVNRVNVPRRTGG